MKSELLLKRVLNTDHATYGVIFHNLKPVLVSLELPWKDNKQNVSCIPAGEYRCTKYNGTRFKDCFWVHDVPNRHAILVHVGNTPNDTQGCILAGQYFGNGCIMNSKWAMDLLNRLLPFEFTLIVKDV